MDPELAADRLAYYGNDARLEGQIVLTIARLPEEVAEFALTRCAFVSAGESAWGLVLPGRVGIDPYTGREPGSPATVAPGDKWIIVLADPLPPDDALSIIAHEIAHAWRGDDRLSLEAEGCERPTAELTAEWGFEGLGAHPDYCEKISSIDVDTPRSGGGSEA